MMDGKRAYAGEILLMRSQFLLFCGILCAFCLTAWASPAAALSLKVNEARMITLPAPAATIFVAEPGIATYQVVTPTRVLLFGRGPGVTSFMALDAEGASLYNATVTVTYNTAMMEAALKREFPSLTLKLTPTADGVVVSGEVPSAQTAGEVVALLDSFVQLTVMSASSDSGSGESEGGKKKSDTKEETEVPSGSLTGPGLGKGPMGARTGRVINRLTVTMPTQVLIRVRMAEVSRGVSEKLGINWFWNSGLRDVRAQGIPGKGTFMFGLATNAVTSGAPHFSTLFADIVPDFSALFEALAEENLVSILAEPNLAVLSGETASFLAGGQAPYPTIGDSGNQGVEYKNYGVTLKVTPTVLSANRISLRVNPEVSELSFANALTINNSNGSSTIVPGLITRTAETTIELASGQSFAIGGLLQNNLNNSVNKIPGLGDVPVLGALFRSSEFQRDETELVIIATAYIGQPSGNTLQIPNADVVIPNVFNRLFLGQKPDVRPGALRPSDFIY